MALEEFLRAWTGTSYRQIPADSRVGVLDFRFAGRSPDNRWNDPGEPTLYLASDHRVVLAKFGRHFETLRDADFRLRNQARQLHPRRFILTAEPDGMLRIDP
jgi:RES domain-containing protein